MSKWTEGTDLTAVAEAVDTGRMDKAILPLLRKLTTAEHFTAELSEGVRILDIITIDDKASAVTVRNLLTQAYAVGGKGLAATLLDEDTVGALDSKAAAGVGKFLGEHPEVADGIEHLTRITPTASSASLTPQGATAAAFGGTGGGFGGESSGSRPGTASVVDDDRDSVASSRFGAPVTASSMRFEHTAASGSWEAVTATLANKHASSSAVAGAIRASADLIDERSRAGGTILNVAMDSDDVGRVRELVVHLDKTVGRKATRALIANSNMDEANPTMQTAVASAVAKPPKTFRKGIASIREGAALALKSGGAIAASHEELAETIPAIEQQMVAVARGTESLIPLPEPDFSAFDGGSTASPAPAPYSGPARLSRSSLLPTDASASASFATMSTLSPLRARPPLSMGEFSASDDGREAPSLAQTLYALVDENAARATAIHTQTHDRKIGAAVQNLSINVQSTLEERAEVGAALPFFEQYTTEATRAVKECQTALDSVEGQTQRAHQQITALDLARSLVIAQIKTDKAPEAAAERHGAGSADGVSTGPNPQAVALQTLVQTAAESPLALLHKDPAGLTLLDRLTQVHNPKVIEAVLTATDRTVITPDRLATALKSNEATTTAQEAFAERIQSINGRFPIAGMKVEGTIRTASVQPTVADYNEQLNAAAGKGDAATIGALLDNAAREAKYQRSERSSGRDVTGALSIGHLLDVVRDTVITEVSKGGKANADVVRTLVSGLGEVTTASTGQEAEGTRAKETFLSGKVNATQTLAQLATASNAPHLVSVIKELGGKVTGATVTATAPRTIAGISVGTTFTAAEAAARKVVTAATTAEARQAKAREDEATAARRATAAEAEMASSNKKLFAAAENGTLTVAAIGRIEDPTILQSKQYSLLHKILKSEELAPAAKVALVSATIGKARELYGVGELGTTLPTRGGANVGQYGAFINFQSRGLGGFGGNLNTTLHKVYSNDSLFPVTAVGSQARFDIQELLLENGASTALRNSKRLTPATYESAANVVVTAAGGSVIDPQQFKAEAAERDADLSGPATFDTGAASANPAFDAFLARQASEAPARPSKGGAAAMPGTAGSGYGGGMGFSGGAYGDARATYAAPPPPPSASASAKSTVQGGTTSLLSRLASLGTAKGTVPGGK